MTNGDNLGGTILHFHLNFEMREDRELMPGSFSFSLWGTTIMTAAEMKQTTSTGSDNIKSDFLHSRKMAR